MSGPSTEASVGTGGQPRPSSSEGRATRPTSLWAPRAWLAGGWHDDVLLRIGADGRWTEIASDMPAPADGDGDGDGTTVLEGALLPGLVDAHSHAFQRAFAGLAERRSAGSDDFWSWRERMYDVANRITPEQLRAVAAQLYVELLCGGYTHACEFHYLQHAPDGSAYADPLTLSWALADAAAESGIGLTILPVLYERAGFDASLRHDQRRFRTDADTVWTLQDTLSRSGRPRLRSGLAIHSLRGATAAGIGTLVERARGWRGPIHVHAAEQTAEVDACIAATGARPIAWLAREGLLDARWQLVHATHSVPGESDAVARSGAGVVLCPGTEANLGDGLCDLGGWLAAGVPITIGSDSQVTRDWCEELRWLEYGQRLAHRSRNIAAAPDIGQPSTAERLFALASTGGAAAAGEPSWGLVVGARADALVVDAQDPALLGIEASHWLDALVFSSPRRPWRDVMVSGSWIVREGRHDGAEAIARRFAAAMEEMRPACTGRQSP